MYNNAFIHLYIFSFEGIQRIHLSYFSNTPPLEKQCVVTMILTQYIPFLLAISNHYFKKSLRNIKLMKA